MALTALIGIAAVGGGIAAWPFVGMAKGWWADAIVVADQHKAFAVAHPGWSFPAQIHTEAVPVEGLPPWKVAREAAARGYTEDCKAKKLEPGEYCGKTGQVALQDGGSAFAPIFLGWLIGPDGEIREHLPIEEAPEHLLHAIVAAEDRAFYEHNGVNFTALGRAVYANAQEGGYAQGASTLTMQLVRNLVQKKEKTLTRKAQEMVMAMAMDAHLGKEGVLQMYLDAPYLGQRGGLSICGFKAAAWHYYRKEPKDLTLGEAATLAAILPAPGKFAPDRNPKEAQERRDRVLQAMKEVYGTDITAALAEPIHVEEPFPLEERFPAFLTATRTYLEKKLDPQVLYGAGLDVTVGMDVAMQAETEEFLPKKTKYFEGFIGRRKEPYQAASVLMDVQTGLIRVIYGGHGQEKNGFNMATQALRQAGSVFKPVVYAMALDQPAGPDGRRPYTAITPVPNQPRVFKTPQGDWRPRNAAGDYSTTSTLARGLASSQNLVAANLLEQLGGPKNLIAFAARLGIDTSRFPEEMGLALGQGEVTVLEMTQVAAVIGSGGYKIEGSPVLRAVDLAGKEILSPPQHGDRVLSQESATITRELMRGVVQHGTGGPARGANGEPGYTGALAGKTGTSDGARDLWFMGITPEYAAVLWLGYEIPTKIYGVQAMDLSAPLWGWWMNRILRGHPFPPSFSSDPPILQKTVCAYTGKTPNGSCRLISAPFFPGTEPKGACGVSHPPPAPEVPSEGDEGSEEGAEGAAPKPKHESLWQRVAREQAEKAAASQAPAPPTP